MSFPIEIVWFSSRFIEDVHPVFHRQSEWTETYVVVCGKVTRGWSDGRTGPPRVNEHGTFMRRDFADRIGRPCRKCWPEVTP